MGVQQRPCKIYSGWKNNISFQTGMGLNSSSSSSSISTLQTASTEEVSWISPLQLESEHLQSAEISYSNITGILLSKGKIALEPDPLFTSPFYIFFTLMSCFGNLAIIIAICSLSKFRKPANLLVANLSLSSLFLMVSVNIRYMEYEFDIWTYTTLWCKTLAVFHRFPVPMVALTTMAISFDRGRVARNPLVRTCSMNPVWRVVFIWCFSLLITAPLGFSRKFEPCITNPFKCSKILLLNSLTLTVSYDLLYLMSVYIVPAFILIQESTKTLRKIRFLRTSTATWSQGQVQIFPSIPDTRHRLLRNSCIFSLIFLVFWLPFGICQFLLDLPRDLLSDVFYGYTQFYIKSLKNISYIQIMMNPVILFILSYDFGRYCNRFKVKCPGFV